MKRLLAIAIVVLALPVSTAIAQPGFEGTWSLDAGRSSALPPGMEQTMTIARDGEALAVKTAIVSDFGERTQEDRYVFDGAEHEVQTPGAGSGQRVATRRDERNFSASDRLEGPNGKTTVERVWSLSADGQELTIELTSNGFAGRTETRRLFVRGERASAPRAVVSRLFPVDLTVPVPPSPFLQGGKAQLVYELALRNFRAGDIEWKRLEVLDPSGRVLAALEGGELAARVSRPGTAPAPAEPCRIGAGMTAVAFLWVSVEGSAPTALRHRAIFSLPAAAGAERILESSPVAVGPPAIVLGPPVRGRGWVARWISNDSFHRRALLTLDGRAVIAQRFAIDWNRYDDRGVEQSGDETQNATYSVYGQPAIAVADAQVAKVIDGVPENSPPDIAPGVGLDAERALGNCVVLALPGGVFATYAHLQPGSLQVKAGDRVRRGQILGRVGNSGNATGPHLHFHLATGPGLEGEGLPYAIETFEELGRESVAGDTPTWDPQGARSTARRRELPVEHSVVAFPGD
jgi:hypothetical protein